MNHIAGITSNYAENGCAGTGRNIDTEKIDKQILNNLFPKYTTLFQRKNQHWDLRLKDRSSVKIKKDSHM
tara:strand:- start:724 stop:933 length:210 start_codon:yes stop_codon:yes gene_type:complete